jgi:hypothetical protein
MLTPKGFRVPQGAVFLSGNRAPGEFRDGNAEPFHDLPSIANLLILNMLASCGYWPLWCKTNRSQEAAMIHRTYFLHYRLVREAITTVVTVGTALLLSYLILWARL